MDEQAAKATGYYDPRTHSRVPPPPMQIIHRGWFKTTITERQAADLMREDREREARDRERSVRAG